MWAQVMQSGCSAQRDTHTDVAITRADQSQSRVLIDAYRSRAVCEIESPGLQTLGVVARARARVPEKESVCVCVVKCVVLAHLLVEKEHERVVLVQLD